MKREKNDYKKIRTKAGLSQARLAECFGLSGASRISEYERGVRNPGGGIKKLYEMLEKNPKLFCDD